MEQKRSILGFKSKLCNNATKLFPKAMAVLVQWMKTYY